LTNALGCLVADLRQDYVRTVNTPVPDLDMAALRRILDEHDATGRAVNAAEADEIVETVVMHAADMQFRGQTHLIRIALPSAAVDRDHLQQLFEVAYFDRFRVRLPEVRAVVVNLVTAVVGRRARLSLAALAEAGGTARPAPVDGLAFTAATVFDRASLGPGCRVDGPAVIRQMDATTWIDPGAHATVDAMGNLKITVGEGA
jgi:N-methylhydantoinase A